MTVRLVHCGPCVRQDSDWSEYTKQRILSGPALIVRSFTLYTVYFGLPLWGAECTGDITQTADGQYSINIHDLLSMNNHLSAIDNREWYHTSIDYSHFIKSQWWRKRDIPPSAGLQIKDLLFHILPILLREGSEHSSGWSEYNMFTRRVAAPTRGQDPSPRFFHKTHARGDPGLVTPERIHRPRIKRNKIVTGTRNSPIASNARHRPFHNGR